VHGALSITVLLLKKNQQYLRVTALPFFIKIYFFKIESKVLPILFLCPGGVYTVQDSNLYGLACNPDA